MMKAGFSYRFEICLTIGPSRRKARKKASTALKENSIVFMAFVHGCFVLKYWIAA
jgi:hypothetical protein